jgi:AcrR family transcriptional regulator
MARAGAASADCAAGGLESRGVPCSQVVEIQRSRLLAAAIRAVDEIGYAETTVAQITARARVSRRTFYELFDNRDDCLAAVLEDVAALVETELTAAGLAQLSWRERVRMGLWRMLCVFDREPVVARVCVVHAMAGGPGALAHRKSLIARLIAVVDEGRAQGSCATDCTPLTAEGVVGAALTVIQGTLARGNGEPLTGLLGELMGMIVLPYQGAGAARREQRRPAPAGRAADIVPSTAHTARTGVDPLAGLPMRLTYRTARVLDGVAGHAGLSNRQVAEHAGIADQGQVSKLLARLERLGLLVNRCEGHVKGEPNAWQLTAKGQLVTQNIRTPTATAAAGSVMRVHDLTRAPKHEITSPGQANALEERS